MCFRLNLQRIWPKSGKHTDSHTNFDLPGKISELLGPVLAIGTLYMSLKQIDS